MGHQNGILYGTLDVELYLEQPEGYGVAGRENDSCLFKKVHLRLETSFKSVERKI